MINCVATPILYGASEEISLLPKEVTSPHYMSIADNYDTFFHHEEDYAEAMLKDINESLALKGSDIIADLGGGTGTWSEKIAKNFNPSLTICVDPIEAMIKYARDKKGILPLCMPVEKFVKNPDHPITKFLAKGSIHHFENHRALYQDIYKCLPIGGKFLIITSADNCRSYPFFKKVDEWLAQQSSTLESLFKETHETSFKVSTSEKTYQAVITKQKWFTMLRGRFISSLSQFSDEEIEEGIKELNHTLQDSENVPISTKWFFITLEKTNESIYPNTFPAVPPQP